jgi:signal transduction histidine kinase
MREKGFFGNLPSLMKSRPAETVLVAAAAAILLFLTLFSFWLTRRVFEDAETAGEFNRFNMRLTTFVQMLRTVESSQRGYLLAGTAEFLEPYKELSARLLPFAENLVADAPKRLDSSKPIAAILGALRAKLGEMAKTIALADEGQRARAIELLKDGTGRKLTDEIEERVRRIQINGAELVQRNEAGERRLQGFKAIVDAIGALLILAFTFGSLWSLLRSNAATEAAQDTLAKANAELEALVSQRTAALTRANEEIQRFAYIVSHDLRSPLVNIMGFTSELETLRGELFERLNKTDGASIPDRLEHDFDEALGFIKSSIIRMERLIAAILRISREGSRPLNREAIDTSAMVQGLLAALAHQIRDKAARVNTGPLPDTFTDRLALEQIFSNLIENAIKFLRPDGDGAVEVRGYISGGELIYTVEDNGRGIDPKDHRRIFELFRRSGHQDVPGEGMGLAYVSALVTRLGGTIEVVSELGKGSVFKVKLPRSIAVEERRAA